MRTKIIATIGPSSSSAEKLQQIIEAGVDVCRLNFSHGSHDDHLQVIHHIHDINRRTGRSVAILADLQGPKIRLGDFSVDSIVLEQGETIVFTTKAIPGRKGKVSIRYESFASDVNPCETILVDDGKIAFNVLSTNGIDEVELVQDPCAVQQ